MRHGAIVSCPVCGKHMPLMVTPQTADEYSAKQACPNCGVEFEYLVTAADANGNRSVVIDGASYELGYMPVFAEAEFKCPSCGGDRKLFITPPSTKMVGLPRTLSGTCPDCGHEMTYLVGYEENRGRKRLYVKIDDEITVYPRLRR